jgi:hypothetical protein
MPLHMPSLPQLLMGSAVQPLPSSATPSGTSLHVPSDPASAQVRQVPEQALLQQTPSTQLPVWHSSPDSQVWPLSFLPHMPISQRKFVVHWALSVHELKQAVPPALHT